MSEHGRDALTKWLLGIAATATVGAGSAAIKTWSDARNLASQVADLKERLSASVSAERISRMEAEIDSLQEEDREIKEQLRALWRRREDSR